MYGDNITEIAKIINNIEWRTTSPGTQLTASINPIFEDEYMWYGRYMLQPTTVLQKIYRYICGFFE